MMLVVLVGNSLFLGPVPYMVKTGIDQPFPISGRGCKNFLNVEKVNLFELTCYQNNVVLL